MPRCQHQSQCVKASNVSAAERKSGDCSRAEYGESGGHFSAQAENTSRMKEAGGVDGEAPTEEAVQEFYFIFAEITLQQVSRGT